MVTNICIICWKEFSVHNYRKDTAKYCCKECSFIGMKWYVPKSAFKKWHVPANKWIPMNKEVKDKLIKANTWRLPWNYWTKWLIIVSNETRKKLSDSNKWKNTWSKWRKQSQSTIEKKRLQTWENSNNWKWWITKLIDLIRRNYKYRQWRSDVFTRDNFICQECWEGKSWKLNAHHIKYLHFLITKNNITTTEEAIECEEIWDINNWITLCEDCHELYHNENWRKYVEQSGESESVEHTSIYGAYWDDEYWL